MRVQYVERYVYEKRVYYVTGHQNIMFYAKDLCNYLVMLEELIGESTLRVQFYRVNMIRR